MLQRRSERNELTFNLSPPSCETLFCRVMSNQNGRYTTASYLPNPRPGLTYIPVAHCQLTSYKENPEDKAIVGVLLKVLHYTASANDDKKVRYNGQSAYQARGNSRQRNVGERHYDRMFTFADVLEPNRCFTIICSSHQDSLNLMGRCARTQEGVGDMFIIIEPDMVEYYLGDTTSVPIVESPKDFIPVTNRFVDSVVPSQLVMPDADHTTYFCLHKQKIKCSRASLESASCSGSFCDRQRLNLGPGQKCGCMYMTAKGSTDVVIDIDITFSVDQQFHPEGKITVSHFRSWKYSNLFVKDVTIWQKLDRDNDLIALRKAVLQICKHIDDNGGWTILGWIRSGRVKDQSSDVNASDTLATLHPKPHISYLFPSENAVATSDAIKALQLAESNQQRRNDE